MHFTLAKKSPQVCPFVGHILSRSSRLRLSEPTSGDCSVRRSTICKFAGEKDHKRRGRWIRFSSSRCQEGFQKKGGDARKALIQRGKSLSGLTLREALPGVSCIRNKYVWYENAMLVGLVLSQGHRERNLISVPQLCRPVQATRRGRGKGAKRAL